MHDAVSRRDFVRAGATAGLGAALVPAFGCTPAPFGQAPAPQQARPPARFACGSGELLHGVRTLLAEIVELLPAPSELPQPVDAPLVGRVFKTLSEPHVGDVSIFRTYSGVLKNGSEVWKIRHDAYEALLRIGLEVGRSVRFVDPL